MCEIAVSLILSIASTAVLRAVSYPREHLVPARSLSIVPGMPTNFIPCSSSNIFPPSSDPFPPITIRESIWTELVERENVNSFRRSLQRIHLDILIDMINEDASLNYDARILARQSLVEIQKLVKNSQHMFGMNEMTSAHYSEINSRISSALNAYLQKKL